MKFYVMAIFIALFINGCSNTLPSVVEYRINPQYKVQKQEMLGCKSHSIKVAEAFSSSGLMSLDMDYAKGENKQFTYSQSQWAVSPNNAISSQMVKLLQDMDIFKVVQISKSRTRTDMILETSIDDFMQYFSEEEHKSFVNVRISLTLIDTKTYKAIATKSVISRIESKSLDANGGVEALNKALEDILSQSAKWLGVVCR